MDVSQIRADFARRMNEVCDALGIAPGHGRQTALGKMFGVTPKGARKWLMGLAYPEMPLAVAICEKAGVNVLWLLQGTPPKQGASVDTSAINLVEGLKALPEDTRNELLSYMQYRFKETGQWFTSERLSRYIEDIEVLKAPSRKQANGDE